jgi:hypothetical protein
MNAPIEIASGKPRGRQPDSDRSRSHAFSWTTTMNLPTLKQVRARSVGSGLIDRWGESKI